MTVCLWEGGVAVRGYMQGRNLTIRGVDVGEGREGGWCLWQHVAVAIQRMKRGRKSERCYEGLVLEAVL